MSGFLTAKYKLAANHFAAWHKEILRLLEKQGNGAELADDAKLIGTDNWEGLLKPARDDLAAHIADKNNPHQETIETLGSYSATTIKSKLTNKMPNGVLPISTYGILDELTDEQMDALWVVDGWKIGCARTITAILGGTYYVIPPSVLDLQSLEVDPANKTLYAFVKLELGAITTQIRTDSPPESDTIMYIGTITTNASGIVSKKFMTVTRIETFRLSRTPVGSAIPFTQGTYENPTKLPASWNP